MQIRPVSKRIVWVLMAALALVVMPALGREKSDVITLKNGNRISGEITRLNQGLLSVKTDSMGTLEIKWGDVLSVTSNYMFRVEDNLGQRYYGTLGVAPNANAVQVIGYTSIDQIEHLSVVQISKFDEGTWDRLSGSLSLGFSFTKANSTTQFNVASDLLYRSRRWEAFTSFDSVLSTFQGETQADRWSAILGVQRHLGRRWYAFASSNFEHNLELELDRRRSGYGGLGRILIQTNRTSLKIGSGMIYSRENYTDEQGRNNLEGAVSTAAHFFKLYSPKIDLEAEFLVIPSLSDAGRIRTELNSGANIEIFKDFFWNVSFYDSYDSKPPRETLSKNDYGLVMGISWTFNK